VEDQPVPDVSSNAPADVRLWVALDVHKFSIVAAVLPSAGGSPELQRIETTEKAIRRLIDRLGGPGGLAVAYEAGPGGFDLLRLLSKLGVACDVIAPSLVPVRAGDRVKTDRRDAKKLVRLYRAGELVFVEPPDERTEGLRDLTRCREDLRCARTAARHRVAKQLLRHGRIFREGKTAWTKTHSAWVHGQRLDDRLAQAALEQMLIHLEGVDRQLALLDAQLEQIADPGALARPGRGADALSRHLHAHRAGADLRDRRRSPVQPSARARQLAGDHAQRILLRRPAAPRPHHQDRQPPRPPAARRICLALPPPPPPLDQDPRTLRPRLASPAASTSTPSRPDRTRQALDGR
jgi:transposase